MFGRFCKANDLVINVKKTEVMLVQCKGTIYVDKQALQQCKTFKYLGVDIAANARSPCHILHARV